MIGKWRGINDNIEFVLKQEVYVRQTFIGRE